MSWGTMINKVEVLIVLAILVAACMPSLASIAQNTQGKISGDFTVVLYQIDTPIYDEYYIVSPFATMEPRSLIYSVNSTCRLYSATIYSQGSYMVELTINNTIQRISIEGGVAHVELTTVDTHGKIADVLLVPGLKALGISVVPVYVWVEDPLTKTLTRRQLLSIYVTGYGTEKITKSYNISSIASTISFSISNFNYTSVMAINYYIQLYYETAEPHKIMIAFTEETGTATRTITTVTTVRETETQAVTVTRTKTETGTATVYTTSTITISSTQYIRNVTTITTTIYKSTTMYHTLMQTEVVTTSIAIPTTITQSATPLTLLMIAMLIMVIVIVLAVYMLRGRKQ